MLVKLVHVLVNTQEWGIRGKANLLFIKDCNVFIKTKGFGGLCAVEGTAGFVQNFRQLDR